MVDLAAIGRARPSRNVKDILDVQRSFRHEERLNRRLAMDEALSREQLNKARIEREKHQKMSAARPFTEIANTFYGGPDGKLAQFAQKNLTRMGLLENVGGVPTYTGYSLEKAGKMFFSDKNMQIQFLQTGIDASAENLRAAQEALAQKPDDEKAQQAVQFHMQAHKEFVGRMDALNKEYLTQEEKQAEADEAARKERETAAKEKQAAAAMLRAEKYQPGGGDKERNLRKEEATEQGRMRLHEYYTEGEGRSLSPTELYMKGNRVTEGGDLYAEDLVSFEKDATGKRIVKPGVVKLKPMTGVLGKRSGPKILLQLGKTYDDMNQLWEQLQDPEVQEELNAIENSTFWNELKGSTENKINAWLQRKGLAVKSEKTRQTMIRMAHIASVIRHEKLGTAVTGTEIESVKGWLISPGDSFSLIRSKAQYAASEAIEDLKQNLDTHKHEADLSGVANAFKIKLFDWWEFPEGSGGRILPTQSTETQGRTRTYVPGQGFTD